MKKSLFNKALCLILSVTILFGAIAVTAFASSSESFKGDSNTAASLEEMKQLVGTVPYAEYIANYATAKPGPSLVKLDNSTVTGNAEKVSESLECIEAWQAHPDLWANFGEENKANSIYLPATGEVTWRFTIPDEAAGLYYIKIEYFNCETSESSISSIERKLLIDDKIPFSEASTLAMTKYWTYDNVVSQVVTDTAEPNGSNVEYYHDDTGYYKVATVISGGKKTVTTYEYRQDINGNSMAPDIEQVSTWNTYYCQDSTGYHSGYFNFYILNGTHTLTLRAEREPIVVKSIELVPTNMEESSIPAYEDVLAEYAANGYTAPADGNVTVLEAEFPDFVSDSSVASTNDNTSAVNYPSSSKADLYNVIGENSYNTVGQWAAYKFTVDKTGLYKLGMRYKQSALQGMYVCRTLKLSGGAYGDAPTVPFMEAYNAKFDYSKDWQSAYISDGNGTDFTFYFEEGKEYTLYVECSLGSLKTPIQRVETSLEIINECYLSILQLTGNSPDEYRDYNFLGVLPEVLIALLEQAIELEAVKEEFELLCGTNGSHITTLETVAILLDKMGSDDGEYIAANMETLKSYLGTLGTWINNSKTSTMVVDSISVVPSDKDAKALKRANANFFQSAGYEISSFFYSFFTDYDQMGLTTVPDENTTTIDVWLATGRDQSQIWRSMVDAQGSFTDMTGVAVTLKLVTAGTLLPSILSGKGPDVYMGLGSADVINYAIRNAIMGVSGNALNANKEPAAYNDAFNNTYYTYKIADGKYETTTTPKDGATPSFTSHTFDDFINGVNGDDPIFTSAAMDTLTLLDVTYGIPQQMSFPMMFYRMDVFANLGKEVPQTWEELLAILPELQTNNMSIGINYINAIDVMLYQMGGNMWKFTDNPDYAGALIDLDSNIAREAFDYVCSFYTDYSFPVTYDAANRFRTGEMPIIVGDYGGIYNTLTVYATEIAGLWEFTSLPGVTRPDGTKNWDSLAGINATVMLHGCDNAFEAWQFIQWQTGDKAQSEYGNRMVALVGPSAKYETANLKAIRNLSWSASEREAIEEQMEHMSSIVNYPGSYIIARYTKFAFLAAVNDGDEPVDALLQYIDAINAEITRKREEFSLPTLEKNEEPPKADSAS